MKILILTAAVLFGWVRCPEASSSALPAKVFASNSPLDWREDMKQLLTVTENKNPDETHITDMLSILSGNDLSSWGTIKERRYPISITKGPTDDELLLMMKGLYRSAKVLRGDDKWGGILEWRISDKNTAERPEVKRHLLYLFRAWQFVIGPLAGEQLGDEEANAIRQTQSDHEREFITKVDALVRGAPKFFRKETVTLQRTSFFTDDSSTTTTTTATPSKLKTRRGGPPIVIKRSSSATSSTSPRPLMTTTTSTGKNPSSKYARDVASEYSSTTTSSTPISTATNFVQNLEKFNVQCTYQNLLKSDWWTKPTKSSQASPLINGWSNVTLNSDGVYRHKSDNSIKLIAFFGTPVGFENKVHENIYGFLSNYYALLEGFNASGYPALALSFVVLNGNTFNHVEGAYQYGKCVIAGKIDPSDSSIRYTFMNANPNQARLEAAKYIPHGTQVDHHIVQKWDELMFELVKQKFTYNVELRDELIKLHGAVLVEGNTRKNPDTKWGAAYNPDAHNVFVALKGENKLGRMLNYIADELKKVRELPYLIRLEGVEVRHGEIVKTTVFNPAEMF